jgi:hypothetical protein
MGRNSHLASVLSSRWTLSSRFLDGIARVITPMRNDMRRRWAGALVGAVVLGALSVPALAGVRVVEGRAGALVVEARDATVEQVLEALGESQNFIFHTSRALTRVLSGTYSGTLSRVLARVLDGYDHVVESTPSGIRVNIVGVAEPGRAAPAGAKIHGTLATMSGTMPANGRLFVSSNVDLDEENAAAAAGIAPVKATAPARPIVNPLPVPAALPGSGGPRISTNVDLDEETSR